MTSPTTDQARQIASTAIQDEARDLNSQRASSFLGPDKPATVRKWFPTGHLAWRRVQFGDVIASLGLGTSHREELVQELFEVEFGPGPGDAKRTGRQEWRTIPILPHDAPVSNCAEILITAFDSTLINQAPHIAGPNQVPPAPG